MQVQKSVKIVMVWLLKKMNAELFFCMRLCQYVRCSIVYGYGCVLSFLLGIQAVGCDLNGNLVFYLVNSVAYVYLFLRIY